MSDSWKDWLFFFHIWFSGMEFSRLLGDMTLGELLRLVF